jgi:hypothetical protein
VSLAERQKVEQELGLGLPFFGAEALQCGSQTVEFRGGEAGGGNVLGERSRLFSCLVPPAHVRDLSGNMGGPLGQVGGDVFTQVSWVH